MCCDVVWYWLNTCSQCRFPNRSNIHTERMPKWARTCISQNKFVWLYHTYHSNNTSDNTWVHNLHDMKLICQFVAWMCVSYCRRALHVRGTTDEKLCVVHRALFLCFDHHAICRGILRYHHSTKLYWKISQICCRLYCYEYAAWITIQMSDIFFLVYMSLSTMVIMILSYKLSISSHIYTDARLVVPDTDSHVTCSKSTTFINYVQPQGFPIDSNTLAWVRCMTRNKNVAHIPLHWW